MLCLTDENFNEEISKNQKAVLVDFWNSWCLPCLVLSPILEKITQDYQDKLILAEANLDRVPSIARKYGIDRIPAVLLFKNGKLVSRFVGVRPEEQIRGWLDKLLKNEK
jgi:thioredoxin